MEMRADVNFEKDLELAKMHGRIVVSVTCRIASMYYSDFYNLMFGLRGLDWTICGKMAG